MLTNLILEKHLSEKMREYEFLELPYLRKVSRETRNWVAVHKKTNKCEEVWAVIDKNGTPTSCTKEAKRKCYAFKPKQTFTIHCDEHE